MQNDKNKPPISHEDLQKIMNNTSDPALIDLALDMMNDPNHPSHAKVRKYVDMVQKAKGEQLHDKGSSGGSIPL